MVSSRARDELTEVGENELDALDAEKPEHFAGDFDVAPHRWPHRRRDRKWRLVEIGNDRASPPRGHVHHPAHDKGSPTLTPGLSSEPPGYRGRTPTRTGFTRARRRHPRVPQNRGASNRHKGAHPAGTERYVGVVVTPSRETSIYDATTHSTRHDSDPAHRDGAADPTRHEDGDHAADVGFPTLDSGLVIGGRTTAAGVTMTQYHDVHAE